MNWFQRGILFLALMLSIPVQSQEASREILLKIVRPEPGEALVLPVGFTFVVGTVSPPDAKVSCNGASCEVTDDGAFIGFVPIRLTNDWTTVTSLVATNRVCDAIFEFHAVHSEKEVNSIVFTATPRSPSLAMVGQEVYDPPQQYEVMRDLWLGLEGGRLGQVIFLGKGSIIPASFGGGESIRCNLGARINESIEVNVQTQDVKRCENFYPKEMAAAFLIHSPDGKSLETQGLGQPGKKETGRHEMPAWGFEFEASAASELRPKTHPGNFESWKSGETNQVMRGLHVCLDPGHHPDRGAIGPRGFEERNSALLISRELGKILEERGARVSFTREEDPLPLRERHRRLDELRPDLLVSVHNNSVGDGQDPRLKHGTQTFYLHPWSKPLAEKIHASMVQALGSEDRGCIRRNLYITRYPGCPAVLLEPEYLILPEMEKKFMDEGHRRKLAQAIADGVEEFVREFHEQTLKDEKPEKSQTGE